MKFHLLMLVFGGALFMSCERQEYEGPNGTKQLNEPHGGHAAHPDGTSHAGHGDAGEKDRKDEKQH